MVIGFTKIWGSTRGFREPGYAQNFVNDSNVMGMLVKLVKGNKIKKASQNLIDSVKLGSWTMQDQELELRRDELPLGD